MMMLQRSTKMIQGFLLLAVIGCTSTQAYPKNTLPVEIHPDNQVAVRQGQSQTILCKLAVGLQVCRFDIPGEGSLVLTQGQPSDDGIDYFGEGLEKGHCGVKISSIKEKHDGNVTCYLTPQNGRTETSNSVRMIVAKPPMTPELSTNKHGAYRIGEQMDIECIAKDGRPPANITLFLDDEPIGDDRGVIYGRTADITMAEIRKSRTVLAEDHGKTLRCVADHIALHQPLEVSRPVDVYFKPQPQETIKQFGYALGRPGKVSVTVHANPMPEVFKWHVGDDVITAGQPDSHNRIQTSSAIDEGRGHWRVELYINSVEKSDTEKKYSLEVHNIEGYANYSIELSSSTEPPAGATMDSGSIIGIVVGVLVLILAVFLIVFARATGRWCFAGGSDSRNIGETDLAEPAESVNLLRFVKPKSGDSTPRRSDTESTGRYSRSEVDAGKTGRPKISLSQLFKRNKDKVSGADTDTVRTVVTMDDEKIPSSVEVTAAKETTNTGHEGGIVYAELDLAHHQQQPTTPRRIEDKTEYAEILYTKPDGQPQEPTPDK